MNREETLNSDEDLMWAVNWHKHSFEEKICQMIGSLKQYPDPELLGLKNALNSVVAEIEQILGQEY